jgi:hypothetical protein
MLAPLGVTRGALAREASVLYRIAVGLTTQHRLALASLACLDDLTVEAEPGAVAACAHLVECGFAERTDRMRYRITPSGVQVHRVQLAGLLMAAAASPELAERIATVLALLAPPRST